ncbi:hypothetical protein [Candidatus Marimicrobium litorale]|uniref:Uncharacterized protein n=1 Tax=Candidatus Marimicrobium litorale TaxID=2518991 RepID=A0ABT3T5G7_9GAMM|nr:hypothetical protein [Candidatus Marimicrobium litorale]MCX2977056.1 hypothetical protein [Candidatus Marimicrobium litorale]
MISQSRTLTAIWAALGVLLTAPVSAQDIDTAACENLQREINHYSDLTYKGGQPRQMQVWKRMRIDAIGRFKYIRCNNVFMAQNAQGTGNSAVQDETVREILAAIDSGDDLSTALPATAAGGSLQGESEASGATLAQRVQAQRTEARQRVRRGGNANQ